MAKEKKISIKCYLNKKLKPRIINGNNHYPVYLMVVYATKNLKFKLTSENQRLFAKKRSDTTIWIDKNIELEELNIIRNSDWFKEKKDKIEKIIRFEFSRNPNFSLTKFSKRLELHELKLIFLVTGGMINLMNNFAMFRLSHVDYIEFSNVKQPTDKIEYLIPYLKKNDKDAKQIIESYIFFISYMIIVDLVNIRQITIFDWVLNGYKQKVLDFFKTSVNTSFLSNPELNKHLNTFKELNISIKVELDTLGKDVVKLVNLLIGYSMDELL